MKERCMPEATNGRAYFLLYVAPLLMGLFFLLSQQAHATWDDGTDPNFATQPQKQGWKTLTNTGAPNTLSSANRQQ